MALHRPDFHAECARVLVVMLACRGRVRKAATMYTYVFADVHGMLHKLENLLARISFSPGRDTLAFLGDYVDRGPHSKGVVDLILNQIDEGVRVICLRGNHEVMWENFLNRKDHLMFLYNGGTATLKSYREASGTDDGSAIPERHREFLQNLLPYYEMDDFILVHAGLRPGIPLQEQQERDLYWIRAESIYSDYDFGKTVIFGHTPFRQPFIGNKRIGIDTGAVYGNKLTCVRLPDLQFFSV
jgi:serine/threonine protein phosphatase 1